MTTDRKLGQVGIWTTVLRSDTPENAAATRDAAAELEDLGYGTVWLGGSPGPADVAPLLAATERITVATGILSIWQHRAEEVAARHAEFERDHPGRFLLGLGVSHAAITEQYRRPYSAMREYLSALDSAPGPVPPGQRVLAALGPKMLELARERAAGAHPYLVTEEHTARARAVLGEDALLAPELKVVLDDDRTRARETARAYLGFYLPAPNYANNLLRLGFTEEDFRDGGSDRLVDAVFALGGPETVRERVDAFLAAGADHVAVQVVTDNPRSDRPRESWRLLAEALPVNG